MASDRILTRKLSIARSLIFSFEQTLRSDARKRRRAAISPRQTQQRSAWQSIV
jgi:hypothetical protein